MTTESGTRRRAEQIARESFGWRELRDEQLDAIEALTSGRDAMVVMPTGAGKSAIYQVAAVLREGITVVVSPLIALQRDQLSGIERAPHAPDAVAVNSAQSESRNREAWESLERGGAEFLLVAPEQLAKPSVLERLRAADVSLIVVDEAHCVSFWGHDFRPDYLRLGDVVAALGHPPTAALTATGAPPVREEIIRRLGLREPLVVATGFDRPNLFLDVVRHADPDEKHRAVLASVEELDTPGIVYVATRAQTEQLADELVERGLRAAHYHGGMAAKSRQSVHDGFLEGRIDVVVATTAFGMGIDKPDVRFVVHGDVPDSVDSYYQEIGRAGRDGEPATTVLHYRSEDLGLRRFFASHAPDREALAAVHAALSRASGFLRPSDLASTAGTTTRRLTGLLNDLEAAGVVVRSRSRVRAVAGVETSDAVDRAVAASEERERIDGSRVEMMRRYAEWTGCRRHALLGYFGEHRSDRCDACDWCRDNPDADPPDSDTRAGPFGVQQRVRHAEWGEGTVMDVEADRLTVFFESVGYRVLALEMVLEHDLLAPE